MIIPLNQESGAGKAKGNPHRLAFQHQLSLWKAVYLSIPSVYKPVWVYLFSFVAKISSGTTIKKRLERKQSLSLPPNIIVIFISSGSIPISIHVLKSFLYVVTVTHRFKEDFVFFPHLLQLKDFAYILCGFYHHCL